MISLHSCFPLNNLIAFSRLVAYAKKLSRKMKVNIIAELAVEDSVMDVPRRRGLFQSGGGGKPQSGCVITVMMDHQI